MSRGFAFPLLLLGSLLRADGLGDLRSALARLNGREAIRATVEYRFWSRQGDDKKPVITEGRATSLVEEGPQGLRMSWSRPVIQAAVEEARAQAKDPEKPASTRRAIEGLKAVDVCDYLDGADELLRTLEGAQQLEEKSEPWQGKPAKLLLIKLAPRLSRRDQKYVKELEATAKIWVGADGLPLGAETRMHMKGRALLVITFEQQSRGTFQFLRSGNRLVVVHHTQESSGSGGGEQGSTRSSVDLRLE